MNEKKEQDAPKLTDFELELLVIERDVAHYRVERLDDLLNRVGVAQGYADASKPKEEATQDFSKLPWEAKQGEKGAYEQTSERACQNSDLWKNLKAELKDHRGFWQNGGYKYWIHHGEETIIDRRKA
jgi:hypothetical protein